MFRCEATRFLDDFAARFTAESGSHGAARKASDRRGSCLRDGLVRTGTGGLDPAPGTRVESRA